MNKQLNQIHVRRRVLLARIAGERALMAELETSWHKPLALADIGFKAIRMARRHPILLGGAVSAMFAFRHNGLVALALLGWRFLHRNPAVLSSGYNYLTTATCIPKVKQESRPGSGPDGSSENSYR